MPTPATIERFLAHCHRRRYPARTDVFRPGDPAGTLYYVVSGSVSIITEEDDGRELILGYFGPGEMVGEMGLFIESDVREVILRTRTQCELAEISYERLYQLFEGTLANDAAHRPAVSDSAVARVKPSCLHRSITARDSRDVSSTSSFKDVETIRQPALKPVVCDCLRDTAHR